MQRVLIASWRQTYCALGKRIFGCKRQFPGLYPRPCSRPARFPTALCAPSSLFSSTTRRSAFHVITHTSKAARAHGPSMDYRVLPSGQTLVYLRDAALADEFVHQYRESLQGPLGIDIEYRPNYLKGCPLNPTALIQLASVDVVLLVQISAMSGQLSLPQHPLCPYSRLEFPHTIRDIIQDHAIIKAGVGIQGLRHGYSPCLTPHFCSTRRCRKAVARLWHKPCRLSRA